MVIAIIPDAASIETLLNNLKEAGFSLKDVSIIMADVKARSALAQDAGPFKAVTAMQLAAKLAGAGVPAQDAKTYADAVSKGKVFVAIRTAPGGDKAAAEMLDDYAPEMVRELPATRIV